MKNRIYKIISLILSLGLIISNCEYAFAGGVNKEETLSDGTKLIYVSTDRIREVCQKYWEKSEEDLFQYNRPDMQEELQNGLTYHFDKNNSLTFVNRYDLGNSGVYEQDWRYIHDFCCFQIEIEYRNKKFEGDKSWHIKYDLVRW